MSQLTNAWDLTQAHPEGAERLRLLTLDRALEALDVAIESHKEAFFADSSMAWQITNGSHGEVSPEYAASVGELRGVREGLKQARDLVARFKEEYK